MSAKEHDYEIAKNVLKSITSLRALAKDLTLDQVKEYMDKLEIIHQEKTEELEEIRSLVEEKEKARLSVIESLESANIEVPNQLKIEITAERILSGEIKFKSKKEKKPKREARAKYALQDENGEWKTWSGRGRMALWITEAKESGISEEELANNAKEYNKANGLD